VKQGKVHRSTATFVRFTPDGKKFITAGLSGTIKIWDGASGRLEHSVQAHVGFINGLAVSPDGRVLVSVGYDSKLHVLYLDSKKTEENTLPAMIVDIGFDPSGQFLLLLGIDQSALFEISSRRLIPLNSGGARAYTHAFSADGRYLALGHPDHVALWDFKTKKKLKNSIVYRSAGLTEGNNHFFAFSKDSSKLYILGEKTPLLVWDLDKNKPALHLDGHRSPIVKARFSPSGHVSASLDRSGIIRLWTTSTGFCFATFSTGATDFVWSQDGKHIIVARNSKFFRRRRAFGRTLSQAHFDFWNVEEQKIDRSIAIPMRADRNYGIYPQTLAMALTPDGNFLVSTHSDNTARKWTLSTGKEKDVLEKNFSSIRDLDISPDGRLIAAVGDNRVVYLWDAKSLRLVKRLTHNEPLTRVQFHPHKEELSVGTRSGKVWIWDWKREEPLLTLSVQDKAVTDLSYRPDGDFLAIAGDNALIRLIDLKSGKQVLGLRCHEQTTRAVDFAPAGAQLLSAGDDQTVQLWALAQPYDYSSYKPFRYRVVDFAVAPDSERIVAVSERGQLKTWTLDGSGVSKTIKVRQDITRHVALSQDGKLVAVAGNPGVILVEIGDKKEEIKTTLTIKGSVLGAEFGRKDHLLYVVCKTNAGHEVQIWDTSAKKLLRTLKQTRKYIGTVIRWALSPSEKHFVTVNREGRVLLWDCLTGALIKQIQVPRRKLLSISFNLSGTELICASRDAALSIWSIPDGHLIKRTQGIGGFIHGLAFHPGGRWLAFVNFNKELKIWDLKTNTAKISMPLTGSGFLERTPVNLQFTPDGQRLICSGPNRMIKVWRFSTLLSVSLESKELYEESRRRTGLRADNLRLEKTISNRLVPYAP
ncbi:MAG: WD40 repeat domain-containing protein, partial [Planctomycetota bacterium]|nr:WD40 repeat domain-containing protein [Planctomycetota bacterium]